MKQAQGQVRKALFTRLNADLSAPAYSTIPQNAQYPHVLIDTITSRRDSAKKCPRQQHTILVSVYDKHTSSDDLLYAIIDEIGESVTDQDDTPYLPLTVTGHEVENQLIGDGMDVPNVDNTIKKKTILIEIWTKEA